MIGSQTPRTFALNSLATASGRLVHLGAMAREDIGIRDIAASLSKLCRFSGATRTFYSVAQHSVLVADMLYDDPIAACYGLLHDAHEAYVGDITRPLRVLIETMAGEDLVSHICNDAQRAIHSSLGLAWPVPISIAAKVRHADDVALATEFRDLMEGDPPVGLPTAWPRAITRTLSWDKAEDQFMDRFNALLPAARAAAA